MESGRAPRRLVGKVEGCFVPCFVEGHRLAYTDFAAPNFRIVYIDLSEAEPTHWRDVVPESDRRIQQVAVAGDQVFVNRADRFSTRIEAFGLDGQRKKDVPFPLYGPVGLLNQTNSTDKLFSVYTPIS